MADRGTADGIAERYRPVLLGRQATGLQEIISALRQCRMHCKRARLP